MKRAVLLVPNPWDFIPQLTDYSIMIINPDTPPARLKYLLDNADWSLLITEHGEQHRDGIFMAEEKMFVYTSGTTGDSKFYSFGQAQVDHCVDQICQSYQLTANDRYVGVMPLWHAHGQAFYWATQRANCQATFVPVSKLAQVHTHEPTFITAIPDIVKALARQKFNHLRFVRTASTPLPPSFYHSFQENFNVPIIEAFGMTEAYSHCFTNPLDGEQRIGTIGLPSGIEAKIAQGRLHIKGPAVVAYDWLDTGDLADQDSAGYYRILGRASDRINVRGYKLDPLSIETQLAELLPDIDKCAVFGTTSVKCIYTGSCSADQVRTALLAISSFCRPDVLQLVDSIPVNASGKVSRAYLDQLY